MSRTPQRCRNPDQKPGFFEKPGFSTRRSVGSPSSPSHIVPARRGFSCFFRSIAGTPDPSRGCEPSQTSVLKTLEVSRGCELLHTFAVHFGNVHGALRITANPMRQGELPGIGPLHAPRM